MRDRGRDHRAETRPNSRFLVVGDMNDPPDSPFLEPLAAAQGLGLVFGLIVCTTAAHCGGPFSFQHLFGG
jgi:hypothetical protein